MLRTELNCKCKRATMEAHRNQVVVTRLQKPTYRAMPRGGGRGGGHGGACARVRMRLHVTPLASGTTACNNAHA